MEVKVLTYTQNPELICAIAMRSTRTKKPAHKLQMLVCPTKYGAEGCAKDCTYKSRCVERMLIQAKEMKHWGVFEHATFTVSVSGVSRSLTHQLVRHRIASYLQQSQRAVEIGMDDIWFVVPPSIEGEEVGDHYAELMADIAKLYEEMVKIGVPKEDARFVLPNATKTHIAITMNARSWLHFLYLRLDKHAQWEIREMAKKILYEFMKISPLIFEGAGEYEC